MRALLSLAASQGLTVLSSRLPGDLLGCYVPRQRRIYLDSRLTPAERRSVLAHELGHAHHGHPCGDDPPPHVLRSRERQADVFAARLLIDAAEYARAERVDPSADAIADELGVTVELIGVYREHCLQRVGTAVYALPRPGAGQRAHRGRVA